MKGYVAQRRGRFYAVIYEGRDSVTGKERRMWHPAGTDRAKAERLAAVGGRRNQGSMPAVPDLRRVSHEPVAAGQEVAARISTYRAMSATWAPHPPGARTDQHPAAAVPADRGALRRPPAPGDGPWPRPEDRL
ncbi:MAG: hypothetical protein M5T61_20255 [Acidimicrobiia bacterium]|nr:hypothetical protein [Acidimicrobiia bacterium]